MAIAKLKIKKAFLEIIKKNNTKMSSPKSHILKLLHNNRTTFSFVFIVLINFVNRNFFSEFVDLF